MKQNDRGIFLHRLAYSESSLIVRFYTLDHGLQSYLFKGAKKKKGVNLMPLATYELNYYGAPNTLLQLSSVIGENISATLQNDIPKTLITFFMAELLDQCLRDSPKDEQIFHFIEDEMAWLEATTEYTSYPIWFLLETSKLLGFYPSLEGDQDTFNLKEGTVGIPKQTLPEFVTGNSTQILKSALTNSREHFLAENFLKSDRLILLNHLLTFFKMHQSNFKGLKSLEILQEILI